MHREWISSRVFWLNLVIPLLVIIASGVLIVGASGDSRHFPVVVAAGVLMSCLAGAWGMARERRSRMLMSGAGPATAATPSLSVEQAATYRDLFENATDIVFTTDLSGHFLAGNKAVQRLLGYTVQEAQSLTWEKLVAPYDMWKARQMYKRHAAGEKQISFELDTVTASGSIKTFEIGSRPMFQDDRLCGFHGIARDVTSRKEMEKQLESARREAELANESKSTFLANMSHEIRTPINGILGFMALFAKTELSAKQKEYLVPVEESARHLLKIINDILDLSKIEAGRFSIDNGIFNYRDVLNSAVELLRPLAENKGLTVTVEHDSRIPEHVVGDGTRLGQIVSNLVSNAIKFTDAGSVSIRSQVGETDTARVPVKIAVNDSGIGIARDQLESLFEPFQQLDVRPDRRYAGTGLGLTISKNLAEAMGGGIRVNSEPGAGTQVTLGIPLARAPVRRSRNASEERNSPPVFSGEGLSALIVDDNEINRRYLRAVLEQYGIEPQEAASGASALRTCWNHCFDLVFMDIHMADMDGVETTKRLRAQIPVYSETPVVAVSADVVGDSGLRFTRQGLDHFIAKPVMEDALTTLLCGIFPERAGTRPDLAAARPSDPGGGRTLDREKGISLASNDETLWRRSVEAFQEQLRQLAPRLHCAVEADRHEESSELAHKLAGSAQYVGAEEIAHYTRALERFAGRGHPAPPGSLMRFGRAVERFLDIDIDDHR